MRLTVLRRMHDFINTGLPDRFARAELLFGGAMPMRTWRAWRVLMQPQAARGMGGMPVLFTRGSGTCTQTQTAKPKWTHRSPVAVQHSSKRDCALGRWRVAAPQTT